MQSSDKIIAAVLLVAGIVWIGLLARKEPDAFVVFVVVIIICLVAYFRNQSRKKSP